MSTNNQGVEEKDQMAPADQEDVDNQNSGSGDQKQENPTADFYKSELDRVNAEKAKLAAEKENYKQGLMAAKKREKQGARESDEGDSEDERLDESKILDRIEEKFAVLERDTVATNIASVLASMSSDSDERKLILHHYQNSIQRSGISPEAVLADLETAKFLANRRRKERDAQEIERIAVNKTTVSGTSAGTNQDRQTKGNMSLNRFSKQEIDLMTRAASRLGLSLQEYVNKNFSNN